MAANDQVRIHELLEYVRGGRIMDAMHEFYHPEVVMEEPAYGRTEGLEANLEREQAFVDGVAEFRNFEAKNVSVGENCSAYENAMAWKSTDGQEIEVEQTCVQEWKDGKIIRERFYYAT